MYVCVESAPLVVMFNTRALFMKPILVSFKKKGPRKLRKNDILAHQNIGSNVGKAKLVHRFTTKKSQNAIEA